MGKTKPNLTERQKQILSLSASGLLAKECAHLLGLAVRTIEAHRVSSVKLLGARNITHAVALAIRKGIIPLAAGAMLGTLVQLPQLKVMEQNYRETEGRNYLKISAQVRKAVCQNEPLHLNDDNKAYCNDNDVIPAK